MNEVLKQLLESANILTDETKEEITTAFDELVKEVRETTITETTAQLHENWIKEREHLIEALDIKVEEALVNEMAELRSDIEEYKDLEVEFAKNLVEAKSELHKEFHDQVGSLIEALDIFVEGQLEEELDELREDLELAKQNHLGKRIYEAFASEFQQYYAPEDSIEGKLSETEARLKDVVTALEEAEDKNRKLVRDQKMKEVLSPLNDKAKEIMEAILRTVETSKLEEAYDRYVGRVLTQSVEEAKSEKESRVLAEGYQQVTEKISKGRVVDGSQHDIIQQRLNEGMYHQANQSVLSEEERAHLRKMAGIV